MIWFNMIENRNVLDLKLCNVKYAKNRCYIYMVGIYKQHIDKYYYYSILTARLFRYYCSIKFDKFTLLKSIKKLTSHLTVN